eukprot:1245901-Alexandrium_andersonii.AAC.1
MARTKERASLGSSDWSAGTLVLMGSSCATLALGSSSPLPASGWPPALGKNSKFPCAATRASEPQCNCCAKGEGSRGS